MNVKKWFSVVLLLTLVVLMAAGCGRNDRRQSEAWTPGPITGSLAIGTPAPELARPTGAAVIVATVAPVVLPTIAAPTAAAPTAAPTRVAPTVAVATAAPTRDPNLVTIAEADVLRAVTSGAVSEQGATLENVGIEFTAGGQMILTAGRVGYGFINADNVTLVGRLLAVDGRLELQTESIAPRGIVTSLIPTIANQALQNYTAQWYIEEVRTTEGQLELRVRP